MSYISSLHFYALTSEPVNPTLAPSTLFFSFEERTQASRIVTVLFEVYALELFFFHQADLALADPAGLALFWGRSSRKADPVVCRGRGEGGEEEEIYQIRKLNGHQLMMFSTTCTRTSELF